MSYVVVGASAGLGRALATGFAAAGHDLVIVASDDRDVRAVASDLALRYSVRIAAVATDLAATQSSVAAVVEAAASLPPIQGILLPAGAIASGDRVQLDVGTVERLTRINYLSHGALIAALLPVLAQQPSAAIVGFGSIAATRGREVNVFYSAAKRALQSFFESLRHSQRATNVIVQYYVVGYLETNLALRVPVWLRADPVALSRRVLRDLHSDFGVAYYPAYWRPVCTLLRLLPWIAYSRLPLSSGPPRERRQLW